jgi:lipopolysaccharide transport system ATP-binding protein
MNDLVIRAENLSKKYVLRHQQEPSGSMREAMSYGFKSMWMRVCGKYNSGISQLLPDYEDFYALNDVSFDISQGDRVGVIGRNGAGKSTLLKILSRITEPSSGRVKMKGRVASLLEVGTGFHPELTGRENIFLNGAILGMGREEIKRKFDEIVAFSEIEKFLDTPVKRYSSGMYVRLAFAVAAHLEPEILIIDEVLAVGDAQFQKKCLGKMESVGSEGRTVLFVSHNLTAVQSLCNKGLLLDCGMVKLFGDAQKVVKSYTSTLTDAKISIYDFSKRKNSSFCLIETIKFNNNESSLFDIKDEIEIIVEYILLKDFSGLNVGMQLFDSNNCCIMSIPDTEMAPERLNFRSRGSYVCSVKIPGMMLNTGLYRIKIGMVVSGCILDSVDDAFFSIEDRSGIVLSVGRSRKNSILSYSVPWDICKKD